MNIFLLIGKFVSYERLDDTNAKLTIQVRRDYKNENGEYPNDNIPLLLTSWYMDVIEEAIALGKLNQDTILSIKGSVLEFKGKLDLLVHKIQFLGTSL